MLLTTPPQRADVDPRPELVVRDGLILLRGSRCGNCRYPMVTAPPRCPVCGHDSMEPAAFGPGGTVFSSTVLRIPVPGRTPPFTLAYVDMDSGPRILAHVNGPDTSLVPGSRVTLSGWNEHGDPVVREFKP
ncbi:Zn-ribbon domain-containing OB-fold protein [Candidatus Poriferisocius sp.]|uniref:Zn-ribbon domain-containing OB-fold protein n=1 Tax=Candidatus Poriferisocius sp. TaxID=3101276 RepID=UPI003B02AB2C